MGMGGLSTICQIRDFVKGGLSNSITIEDLIYEQFVIVLHEDIQFDKARHTISYHYSDSITIPIENKWSWKATIREMYIEGLDRFVFHVKEKSECPTISKHEYYLLSSKRSSYRYIG